MLHSLHTPIADDFYWHKFLHLLEWGVLVAKLNIKNVIFGLINLDFVEVWDIYNI
jgi:hypothetical protein